MNLTFITYTHADYSDIWPITCDGVEKLIPLQFERVFACNKLPNNPLIEQLYSKCITYDDTLTYPQRVAQILEQIQTDYVFFVHDIDVILDFNLSTFLSLFKLIETYNLDRLFFGIVKPTDEIITDGRLILTRAKFSHIYILPYDVGPSIWKCSVFLEMMQKYKNETYRSIEQSGIQEDLSRYNCFAIAPSLYYAPLFQLARPVSSDFKFIHILASGKWFEMVCYMDLQLDLFRLLEKYNIDMSKRGFGCGKHLLLISRCLERVEHR